MTRALDVYLNDVKAGSLQQSADGALMFGYRAEYLAESDKRGISVSMPLREEPYHDRVARPYFSGLLPDERARQRLAAALGVSEGNAFGLLEVIGGECAGALSLVPQGAAMPPAGTQLPEILTPQRLADVLELLRARPLLGGEDGIRLSLAGAQDKIAVCVIGGDVALAKDGRPTTHILKPFIPGLDGSVENELFCMKLAGRLGLPVADVDSGKAGATDFLLVRRYDRVSDKFGTILRLHQEDFCQALSIPPELKYEDEGGPGIAQSQALLADQARQPAADRLAFQRMLIFHYLVGNADAHGKNYALLYTNKVPDLAPLYDVVCTAAYPRLAKTLAMKIGGRAIADTIQLKHWLAIVPDTKGAARLLTKTLRELALSIREHSDPLIADLKDQGVDHPVLARVRSVIETRATHVLRITEGA